MRLEEEKSGEMTNSEGLPSKLPKAQRKQLQVELAPSSSNRAKQLKIADKICNVRDIAVSPPANWPLQRRRDYLEWAEKVVAGCRVVNDRLDQAFDQAIANARDALELKAYSEITGEHVIYVGVHQVAAPVSPFLRGHFWPPPDYSLPA
jgi:hypothetical protein